MKFVTIKVVDKPKSFQKAKFTLAEWNEAAKTKTITLPVATALENIRLSKGLYEIVKETAEIEVRAEINPEEMSNQELAQMMTSFGKPPKKKMTREKAVEFVKKLLADAAEMIGDEEEDDEEAE